MVLLEVLINAFRFILSTLKFVQDSFSNQFEFIFSPFLLLYCFLGFLDLFIYVH